MGSFDPEGYNVIFVISVVCPNPGHFRYLPLYNIFANNVSPGNKMKVGSSISLQYDQIRLRPFRWKTARLPPQMWPFHTH